MAGRPYPRGPEPLTQPTQASGPDLVHASQSFQIPVDVMTEYKVVLTALNRAHNTFNLARSLRDLVTFMPTRDDPGIHGAIANICDIHIRDAHMTPKLELRVAW